MDNNNTMDLSQIPALQPPTGTVSNFIDPTNRGPTYVAVASIFLGLATVFVGVRLWARCIIQRSPWWDDLVCVIALLCQGAYCGLNMWLCLHGVGKHMWDVRALEFPPLIDPARAMADVTELSIGFTKLALLMFYYKLFWPNVATRIGSIVGMALIVPLYAILFFCFVFLDTAQTVPLNKGMAILNVLSDFYILILPITSVMQLHLERKKRLGLAALFSTGLFACIMSIVGAVYRFRFAEDGVDFTWGLLNVILVNTIECSIGIMCACLPLFPAVFGNPLLTMQWITTLRSLRNRLISSGSNRSRPSVNGYSRSKSNGEGDCFEMKPKNGPVDGKLHSASITATQTPASSAGSRGGIEVRKDFSVNSVDRMA
ncbi:uncharacterized protein F4812DRAFT_462728 [Daldinia caldariorum]|uniref:uncharacterized protein n=1 Tax=Daldinia caldariorum TaxID=326644 RepID=UPI002007DB33|nr:uncharacterized protein F4812DRAFT_462728 [Daldinia caldariorum]KAI1464313.1 hypothetical protein F4812DRAFT_462728 [Daldinia caldariorum]